MPRFPRPSPCPFARDPAGSLSCHTSNSSPVHFRTRPLRCLTLPASQTSQHLNPQPFIIMSRADGRAFVIDAAGSTEITAASSNFLRALASAGTAPPRSAENTSINDPTPTQALTLPVPTEVDAALENSNALVPAAPVATSWHLLLQDLARGAPRAGSTFLEPTSCTRRLLVLGGEENRAPRRRMPMPHLRMEPLSPPTEGSPLTADTSRMTTPRVCDADAEG